VLPQPVKISVTAAAKVRMVSCFMLFVFQQETCRAPFSAASPRAFSGQGMGTSRPRVLEA
jgi:hypothetical protein